MKLIFRISTIIMVCLTFKVSMAELVPPIFSHFWYSSAQPRITDACRRYEYTYKNKIVVDTAESAAKSLLKNLPPHTDCTWNDAHLIEKYGLTRLPNDFVGSNIDWQQIIFSDPDMKQSVQTWGKECIDNKGNTVDQQSVTVSPSYMCPSGSRRSGGDRGCTTAPETCPSDIVGRDLKTPVGGPLGHLGLLSDDGLVLEAINKNPAINNLYLSDFKKKTQYWGAKYGEKDAPELDYEQATDIFNVALAQETCDPQYTIAQGYEPCGAGNDPKFRCDTYVYYAYDEGAKIKLAKDYITTPTAIFNSLQYSRFNGDSNYSAKKQLLSPIMARFFDADTMEKIIFRKISSRLSANNLMVLNRFLNIYIKNSMVPRQRKLTFIWKLANKYQESSKKYGFLMDWLSTLKPIELTTLLINKFNKTKKPFIKYRVTRELFSAAEEKSIRYTRLLYIKNLPLIQEFFRNLLSSNKDPDIFINALIRFPGITNTQDAYNSIQLALHRHDVSDKTRARIYLDPGFYRSMIQLAFSSKNLQNTLLPSLLDNMIAQSKKPIINELKTRSDKSPIINIYGFLNSKQRYQERLFNFVLYSHLANFDISQLTPSTKSILHEYLEKQKPEIQFNRIKNRKAMVSLILIKQYYLWLNAYISMDSSSNTEKRLKITDYLLNLNSNYKKALLISVANKYLISSLSFPQKQALKIIFKDMLKDEHEKTYWTAALLGLKQLRN